MGAPYGNKNAAVPHTKSGKPIPRTVIGRKYKFSYRLKQVSLAKSKRVKFLKQQTKSRRKSIASFKKYHH